MNAVTIFAAPPTAVRLVVNDSTCYRFETSRQREPVLALIAIILFPFAIWALWKNIQMAKASTAWPGVDGIVTATERKRIALRMQPRVAYSYAVNGVNFTSNRISFAAAIPKKEIDSVLTRYPAGQGVTVHYQPDNPAQAVLEPGSGPNVVAPFRNLIIIFIFLIVANVISFVLKYHEPSKPHIRTYDDVAAADPKLGDRLIRQDAEKGNAQDQFYVGTWYLLGHDVAKDPAEAAKWFRKSADQGYADAQVYLGQLYGSGSGVEKNLSEAIALFRKSATQQNIRAYVCLGYSYEKGLGVPQDNQQAAEWYHKAQGDPHAEAGLKRLAGVKP